MVRAHWLADSCDIQCTTGWSHLVRSYAKIQRHIIKEPETARCWGYRECRTYCACHGWGQKPKVFPQILKQFYQSLEHITLAEEHVCSTKSECSIRVNCHWRGMKLASSKYGTSFIAFKHFSLWLCDRLFFQSVSSQYFISFFLPDLQITYVNEIQILPGIYLLHTVLVSLWSCLCKYT